MAFLNLSSSALAVVLALLVLAAAAPAAAGDPKYASNTGRSTPACQAYAGSFPYAQTVTDCIVKNMCFTRTYCCADVTTTDMNACLDITAYACNVTAVCADHTSVAGEPAWYARTLNGGASVMCCQDVPPTTTPVPVRPPIGYVDSSSANAAASNQTDPLPSMTCDETTLTACPVVMLFAPIIRAFCNNSIPNTYSDAYLNANAVRTCCQYASGPIAGSGTSSPSVGKVACGGGILDLPKLGEYHCDLDVRATTKMCCNGQIEHDSSARSSSGSSASSSVYTYISNECLYDGDSGDHAAAPTLTMAQCLAVVLMLAATVYMTV